MVQGVSLPLDKRTVTVKPRIIRSSFKNNPKTVPPIISHFKVYSFVIIV